MNQRSVLLLATTFLLLNSPAFAAPDFEKDVKPILDQNCLSCHQEGGTGYEASGFSMVSYDDLMKGTKFGAMVIGGDAAGFPSSSKVGDYSESAEGDPTDLSAP